MNKEMLLIAGVAAVAFFAVVKPAMDREKEKKKALEQDQRKEEASTGIMVGIGSLLGSSGKLAGASASLMDKISEMM